MFLFESNVFGNMRMLRFWLPPEYDDGALINALTKRVNRTTTKPPRSKLRAGLARELEALIKPTNFRALLSNPGER